MQISDLIEAPAMEQVQCITPWLSHANETNEAARRHALFREMALQVLHANYPWLVRVLENAGGQVLASEGHFYVALPSDLSDWIEIAELSAHLRLVPWAEPDEVAQ